MKRVSVLVILLAIFMFYACDEVADAVFKDVKGVFKGTTKEYLNITIDISKQDKDRLEGTVKFEINQAKVPEGDTLVKYIPSKDSAFTGEIVLNRVVLTTDE
ncbi:MAG: hypothetical protein ACPL7I_05645, partial [Myxococcota bacterium]